MKFIVIKASDRTKVLGYVDHNNSNIEELTNKFNEYSLYNFKVNDLIFYPIMDCEVRDTLLRIRDILNQAVVTADKMRLDKYAKFLIEVTQVAIDERIEKLLSFDNIKNKMEKTNENNEVDILKRCGWSVE